MKRTILDIPPPVGSKHVFWEHAMKSVFAFVGMFALLFFGPMFLVSGSRRRGGNGDGPAKDFLLYMIEHPEIQFLLCTLAVVVYNIYIVFKNSPKKFVVSINVQGDNVEIGLTNLYYKYLIVKSVPIADFYYVIDTKKVGEKEKRQTLKLMDKSISSEIGAIKPRHFIWEKHLSQVKDAIQEMKKLGLDSKSVR